MHCGIADGRPWSVGDNENLAVGQGDVEATPLQLAVAYSAIANGGNVVRPHVGLEVDAPDGTVLQKIDPPPPAHVTHRQPNLDAIRQGSATPPRSPAARRQTCSPASPQPVYGKTGTAQRPPRPTSPGTCASSRLRKRPILVVVTVEQGGFGAQAAAPGRAPDPLAVVLRQARPVRRRDLEDAVSVDSDPCRRSSRSLPRPRIS